jgi:hypothetical protein
MTTEVLERLVPLLVDASSALRGILTDWDNIDPELQEHYTLDTEWLLRAVRQQIRVRFGDAGARNALLDAERACEKIVAIGDEIERAMGFRPEAILPLGLGAVSPAGLVHDVEKPKS